MMTKDISLAGSFIDLARSRLSKDYLPEIRRCFDFLTEEDLWWRSHETDNSVGNLILHLCGNVRQWIISGIGGAKDVRERPKEFSERGPIPKRDILEKLEDTLAEADRVLASFDTSLLLEVRTIQGFEVTCLEAILSVVVHFAKHTGQIIYVTKMRRGVDLKFYDL